MARKKAVSLEDLDDEIARLEAEIAALEEGLSPEAATKRVRESAARGEIPRREERVPVRAHADDAALDTADAEEADAEAPKKKRKLLGRLKRAKKDTGEAAETASDDADAPEDADAGDAADDAGPVEDAKPKRKGLLKALPGRKRKKADDAAAEDAPAPDAADAAPAEPKAPVAAPEAPMTPAPDLAPPALDGVEWQRVNGTWVRRAKDVEPEAVRRVLDAEGEVVEEAPATEEDLAVLQQDEKQESAGRKLLGFLSRRAR